MIANAPDPATTLARLRSEVSSALSAADAQAAQSVATLQLVYQARVAHLTRTAAAMAAHYGADAPQVKQAEADVAAATETAGRVSLAKEQVATPAPTVSASGWALHGRVVDAQYQPLSGYSVFLVDANKTYQSQYGFAYTDKSGYFLINYAGPTDADQKQQPTPLFLAVADAKAKPAFLGTAQLQPAPGSATYKNIVLTAGGQSIGNPPKSIRKTGIPGGGKKKRPTRG